MPFISPEPPNRPDRSIKLYKNVGNDPLQSGYVYNGKFHTDLWDEYASGYLECTKSLIKNVKDDKFGGDTFGYPIFFLYSHYLELRLKVIIKTGRSLIDEDPKYPNSHDLQSLWSDCKKLFFKVHNLKSDADLDSEWKQDFLIIDHFIKEIARDNKAQSFRYPVDTNGNELLEDDSIEVLNVPNLFVVVEWLSMTLDGISGVFQEYLQQRNDMKAYYRDVYQ